MNLARLLTITLGLALCALAFLPGRRSRVVAFLRGIGMQAVLAVPVGVAQFLFAIEGADRGDFPALVSAPFLGVLYNIGGLTCDAAFESIARAGLLDHRQSTVADNGAVYAALALLQAAVLAGVIASRTRLTGRILADRTILIVLGCCLANSILGITWPWWGT
ncbi:MAG: hypothetical protein IPJ41_10460 [Phycisphaerales bacterium]|nr:hypothetical protein [Phycisphaerales bacterium]